jgi:hypothetical protein
MTAVAAVFAARDFESLSVILTALLMAGPALNTPEVLSGGTPAPVADNPTLARFRKAVFDPWAMAAPCIELDAACAPCALLVIAGGVSPPPPRLRHAVPYTASPKISTGMSAALPNLFMEPSSFRFPPYTADCG